MMLLSDVPDKLSISSFVYQMYNYFTRDVRSAVIKPHPPQQSCSSPVSPSSFDISRFEEILNITSISPTNKSLTVNNPYSRHSSLSRDVTAVVSSSDIEATPPEPLIVTDSPPGGVAPSNQSTQPFQSTPLAKPHPLVSADEELSTLDESKPHPPISNEHLSDTKRPCPSDAERPHPSGTEIPHPPESSECEPVTKDREDHKPLPLLLDERSNSPNQVSNLFCLIFIFIFILEQEQKS